ncbi:4-hydroxybenzoate polyprenyltransferase [Pontibacter ummariensis]|uniref:4-hydroxybenzoate polyprenyltransferase n=1 Tax=Pontibacter ummariensis TaxID=1610492 RepID=A0A239ITU8_9BACT|nr:UbiA-like protein EboC [Pontibacter ummariensis]PRY09693.1 4-hydroxybenzoate polyprenyltransferase [Pontibacter ummariensis]SNS95854.1 4-hydroxybenzoate polyprenyltransferase [Pontibacter ummariensis]
MAQVGAYLRLMRPANIVTAIADIMMGYAASGALLSLFEVDLSAQNLHPLGWLVLSTIGLYGGGVVFNDVFDAELDRVERPERPIPSGRATLAGATTLGALLLVGGVFAAWQVSAMSAAIATIVALLALLYDWKGKHQSLLGPVNMGACRGGNLLLGVSAVPAALEELWFIALIPIVYISAITMVSRGEVHGGNQAALKGAVFMYAAVFAGIISLAALPQFNLVYCIPFLLLFAYLIFPPLLKAMSAKEPKLIMKAVKAGVLSLIVLDASMAAGFAGWQYGLLVLLLLPVSLYIARNFAVT